MGHGNGDDQLLPKLVCNMRTEFASARRKNDTTENENANFGCFVQVEALLGYQVIDVACGSGDAQTLCITADDNVWSWGDGDYGKLGRGGADGCSVSWNSRVLYVISFKRVGDTKLILSFSMISDTVEDRIAGWPWSHKGRMWVSVFCGAHSFR